MNVGVNNRATAINQIFVGVNNIAKLVYGNLGGSEPKLSFVYQILLVVALLLVMKHLIELNYI